MAQSPKQKAAFKKMIAARKASLAGKPRKKDAKAAKALKGARGRKHHKPSPATIKAMRAGAKRYWANRRGSGRPGKGQHIPLKQLKKNVVNLEKLIKVREKSPASWS